jgi:predicted polyphosphate/ATP-dependent NAD kinase
MHKIGLIVNPVAGLGGKVGLKGSDGENICQMALKLGAVPESNSKACITLQVLQKIQDELFFYTYPGEMGEDIVRAHGFQTEVLGDIEKGHTRPVDTMQAARDMAAAGVQLILFAGGDGTARNILDAVGTSVTVIGIPTGCKIHSAVYAINPRKAGELVIQVLQGKIAAAREAEVMDIDEELFRQNTVQARLYGYLKVPLERSLVQNMKSGRGLSEAASLEQMAGYITDTMEKDTLYIIGPGSTTRAIMEKIGLKNTLLGVDLVCNGMLLANDVTEKDILAALSVHKKCKVIVTVIGGQGYVFGRGNQQLSAAVLRRAGKENIVIVASKDKMLSLMGQKLYVDTDNDETNRYLCGYYKVVVGYEDSVMFGLTN